MDHGDDIEGLEDGSPRPDPDELARTRRFLSASAAWSTDRGVKALYADLLYLEKIAEPFFLGLDYDQDTSDIDELGPF